MKDGISFISGMANQKYETAEDAVKSALGFKNTHFYLDLCVASNHIEEWTESRVKNLKRDIEGSNLTAIVHGDGTNPLGSPIEKVRKAAVSVLMDEIKFTANFGSILIVHGGQHFSPKNLKKNRAIVFDNFVTSLDEVQICLNEYNVEIWVENLSNYKSRHPFFNVFSSETNVEDLARIRPKYKLLLDIGHINIESDEYFHLIKSCSSQIAAFSLSDNNGESDSHHMLGKGGISWNKFLDEVGASQWRGVIVIENANPAYSTQDACDYLKSISLSHL